jgi:hypothetical protein
MGKEEYGAEQLGGFVCRLRKRKSMPYVNQETFYPKLFTQFNFERPFNRGFEHKWVKAGLCKTVRD